jgi:glutathionylspermidine synthase
MRRDPRIPRADWQARVESVGLPHHTGAGGAPYWDESACYTFGADEIDELEAATAELHRLCLAAVEHVVTRGRWAELAIPPAAVPLVERSWRAREPTLYGRFDLAYDARTPPRLSSTTPTRPPRSSRPRWRSGTGSRTPSPRATSSTRCTSGSWPRGRR